MASRMDRYKEDESRITGRSDRNKSLYKQIEDLDSYTNIAWVATIDNKNSIDLEKVKELLRHSEKKEEIILDEEIIEEKELEETRKYDIKDLLSKAKDTDNEENKYRSLSKEHYKLLEELNEKRDYCNAQMESKLLHQYANPDEKGLNLLRTAMTRLNLSARAYDRILKVARTIADLEGSESIQSNHLAEAISYRNLDRESWGG